MRINNSSILCSDFIRQNRADRLHPILLQYCCTTIALALNTQQCCTVRVPELERLARDRLETLWTMWSVEYCTVVVELSKKGPLDFLLLTYSSERFGVTYSSFHFSGSLERFCRGNVRSLLFRVAFGHESKGDPGINNQTRNNYPLVLFCLPLEKSKKRYIHNLL